MKYFGELIKKARENKKLTIQQLSTISGITTIEIKNLEKGIRKPNAMTIYKLSKALDYDYNKLFNASLMK